MKTLFLIRHAKSSWSDPSLMDFDRPLNKRGKRDAPFMGKRLSEAVGGVDLFLSSSAKRAAKTAKIIAGKIGFDKRAIDFRDEIYHADVVGLLQIIRSTDAGVNSLCLVGHNYVITDLAEFLSGETLINIPTCGIVAIGFRDRGWNQISGDDGELLFFDYPKLHVHRGNGG